MTNPELVRPDQSIELPGAQLLVGAVDGHIHCCPHINSRTVTVFDAVRAAARGRMRAIGLMDVFANSSGLAALAMLELGHLGVEVFGGIILEPYVGGLAERVVETALRMGYGPRSGARFVSLPCHHTQFIARSEGRSPAYVETCLAIPERGPLPSPLPTILDQVAAADVVFNIGHLSGPEALRVAEEACRHGVGRILAPALYFTPEEVAALAAQGVYCEFSFFAMSHATQVGQTMIDAEKHRFAHVDLDSVARAIRAAGCDKVILSSDSGSYVLAPPVEAFREHIVMIQSAGFSDAEMRLMVADNAAMLFRIGQ